MVHYFLPSLKCKYKDKMLNCNQLKFQKHASDACHKNMMSLESQNGHGMNIIKRVTLVYLYHVNRCGHHKKLSIAKLDFDCTSLRTVAEFLQQYSA